jgi:hypothetical protein
MKKLILSLLALAAILSVFGQDVTIRRGSGSSSGITVAAGTNVVTTTNGSIVSINVPSASTSNEKFVVFTTDPETGASTIVKSSGVDSITDNAGGDYTINFTTTPTSDANYAVLLTGRGEPTGSIICMEQHDTPVRTTTAVRIYTLRLNALSTLVLAHPEYCSVLIKY